MKAFKIDKPGKYTYIEIPEPKIKSDEVLVKIARLGLCGSDLNTFRGLNPLVIYPRIIGHEISGIIKETGKDVPENIKTGMTVTVIPYTSCGNCASCLSGRTNACENNQTLGVQREGASAEYITVPFNKIISSQKLKFDELVLVEPLSVGFHAVKRGKLSSNDFVAVFGCGMIGFGAILGALVKSRKVIAIDIADDKLQLAKKFGVTYTVNPKNENLHQSLMDITNGMGPNVIIEAVGSPVTYKQAIEEVAFSGRVVYIGYAKENVSYTTKLFVMKEIDIYGSRNADKEDFNNVIQILEKRNIPVNELISKKVPFEKLGEAIADWSNDPSKIVKIVVDMDVTL